MRDCENHDIMECPGDTSCPDWGKCKASKEIIAEEPEYYYPDGRLRDGR